MTANQTVRHRNRLKRIVGWIFIYLLIFAAFMAVMYRQAIKVNTLDFPKGQIQVTTSKTKYTVGDTITYTINNGLNKAITLVYNCPQEPLHVYQWVNNTWNRIHDTATAAACAGQPNQFSIPAGGSVTKNYAAWANLFNKPGIFRIVAFADNYTGIPYADFQVVAPPPKPVPAPAPQIIYKPVYTPVYTPIYVPTPTPTRDGGGD